MAKDLEKLQRIYRKTNGYCHICHKKLSLKNHGVYGARGAWHIEHSKPKAREGTNHINNLFPACIRCNLEKGTMLTKVARQKNGISRAPFSANKKAQMKRQNTTSGVIVGGVIGSAAGPIGIVVGATIGGLIGSENSPKK